MSSAPLFFGIAGGTGSGKSTVAQKVMDGLPQGSAVIIDHDSYYRSHGDLSPEELRRINYDHPDALDNALLVEHLDQLKQGNTAHIPQYDFVEHRRRDETRAVIAAPIVIVEGILVFVDAAIRQRLDVKLFVDTDADIRIMRRVRRDMEQRGRTFQQIRDQYYTSVRPMHLQFVEPSKRWADLIIPEGGDNRVALDLVVGKLLNHLGE